MLVYVFFLTKFSPLMSYMEMRSIKRLMHNEYRFSCCACRFARLLYLKCVLSLLMLFNRCSFPRQSSGLYFSAWIVTVKLPFGRLMQEHCKDVLFFAVFFFCRKQAMGGGRRGRKRKVRSFVEPLRARSIMKWSAARFSVMNE